MEKFFEEVNALIDDMTDDFFENLSESIAIPSVEGAPLEGAPFGREVEKSLEQFLAIAEKMGFHTENKDGYVGLVEWGEGEEMLGILSHIDVVPAGDLNAWDSDPFTMTEKDGLVIGRGVADDKGPLFSCLYGMYALKEKGFVPKRRIRFIVGTNEETGWGCIHYYKDNNMEVPTMSFSPDGMYTVVNREKGIFQATYNLGLETSSVIEAGEAPNLVPAHANATVCGKEYSFTGKNAPSHTPANGESAIEKLLIALADAEEEPLAKAAKDLLSVTKGTDGAGMDLVCEDEASGKLTANLGLLNLKDNKLTAVLDVRVPVTVDFNEIVKKVDAAMTGIGYEKTAETLKPALYVPGDTELIKSLCEVYEEVTGKEAVLYSIGGGTYARAFGNCVCFGAAYPDEPLTVHMPNERTLKANIIQNTKMYARAIHKLTK